MSTDTAPALVLSDQALADAREVAAWYAIDLAGAMTDDGGEMTCVHAFEYVAAVREAIRLTRALEVGWCVTLTDEQARLLALAAEEADEMETALAEDAECILGRPPTDPREIAFAEFHGGRASIARRLADRLAEEGLLVEQD